MSISRDLAKRQIAATQRFFRILLKTLEQRQITPELHDAQRDLNKCTTDLTRVVYQPNEGNEP